MRLRLMAFTILLIVCAAGVVGSISVAILWRLGHQTTLSHLSAVSTLRQSELNALKDNLLSDLRVIASERVVQESLSQGPEQLALKGTSLEVRGLLDNRFLEIAQLSKTVEEIFLLDNQGYMYASSGRYEGPRFRRHEKYFKEINRERRDFVLHVQDRAYSSTTEELNSVIVAIPLWADGFDSPWVLAVQTNPNILNQIMTSHIGMGQTGEMFLVSSNQSMITDSRFPGYESGITYLTSEPIAATLADKQVRNGQFTDYRGVQVLSSYTYIPAYQAVLVAKQDAQEAMQPVFTMILYGAMAMIPATFLAIGLAIFLARRTTEPIVRLEQATTAISSGDYSSPITISGSHEIGRLAQNFDKMRVDIKARIEELDAVNSSLRAEIDRRQKAQEELEAAQRLEAIGRVAGGVAHDFNNMLGIISGFAEMCLDMAEDTGPQKKWLREILSAVERSSNMTSELLAYSKRRPLDPETLDLGRVVKLHTAPIEKVLGPEIQVALVLPKSSVWVHLDLSQFHRALINLAANARDALAGSGKVTIFLSTTENHVRLYFGDDGPGIPEKIATTLFEPFVTTKGIGRGTGLGLAVVKGLVEQSEGRLWLLDHDAHSPPDPAMTGAVFVMEFPLSEEPADATTPVEGETRGWTKSASASSKIMVVDDESASVRMLERMLSDLGYQVTASESATWAAEHITEVRPDLLLSDINMPELDGYALAQSARAAIPGLPVILISGALAEAPPDGNYHIVPKPVSLRQLSATIAELLKDKSSVV